VDNLEVRSPTGAELPHLHRLLAQAWGDLFVACHGTSYDLTALPAVVAVAAGRIRGAVTYRIDGAACEMVSVNAFTDRRGVGTALVEHAAALAARHGCSRLWCTTTNDNVDALRFYQRRGFRLVALRPGAVDQARRHVKPQIPATGAHGIPLRDEIDVERAL
jgi:ribosomal protein S18 acetylase RimI-like enzyme